MVVFKPDSDLSGMLVPHYYYYYVGALPFSSGSFWKETAAPLLIN